MNYLTVKELREELDQYPDDWIFTIDDPRLADFVHIRGTYGFDEGEVGLTLTN